MSNPTDPELSDDDLNEDDVSAPIVEEKSYSAQSSIVRANDEEQSVPLWLITFTDVMALMLTFFVLLYAMSVPQEDKWEGISSALSFKLNKFEGDLFNAGSQDVINIGKISTSKALDLRYLKTIITSLLKERGIDEALIYQNNKRLIVSLPSELLFESGSAQIGLEGKKVLFAMGGILARVKNRIEVVGHTDPNPINDDKAMYRNNWELSLARAAALSAVLYEVGYSEDIAIRGLSSARYDEMSADASQEERYKLSRRVDIILMEDDGYRYNAFKP